MALANPLSRKPARPPRPSSRSDYFADSVHGAVERIARQCPDALVGVTFGIEDVPYLQTAWSGDHVPLAAAVEGDEERLGQVVIYRRPLEHRATSRRGLRTLVYRTIVEQLSALTGRTIDEIDPDGTMDDD